MRSPFMAVCITVMCITSFDSAAQCDSFGPWVKVQWQNSSAVFDFGTPVGTSRFNYQYDFGTVDLGLTAILPINLYNCHPADAQPIQQISGRNYVVSLTNCSGSSASEWDASSMIDFDIPVIVSGTASAVHNLTFSAETPGLREAILIITYYDEDLGFGNPPTPSGCYYTPAASSPAVTLTIKLTANVVAPTPINSILVVDKSGSMGDLASPTTSTTIRKIDALQEALHVYYDALAPIDYFGVAAFSNTASTIAPLTVKGTSALPAAVDASQTASGGNLYPSGSTSIGAGFQEGKNISDANPAATGFKNILILQTDGIQNTPPDFTAIPYDPSTVNIYTVGLGPDVQDGYLIGISGVDRFFKVVGATAGPDLSMFYGKVYAQANNMSTVTDPTIMVNLSHGAQTPFTSTLTLADKSAMFLVLEGGPTERYKTELVNPKGDVVTSATTIGGAPVEVVHNGSHTIYKVHGAKDNTFVGTWKLNVIPFKDCQENCDVSVSFSAFVKSNLTMHMSVLSGSYLPGSPITVTTRLTDSRLPLVSGYVVAEITRPGDKKLYRIRLFDDGKGVDQFAGDGLYSVQFIETSAIGTYEVKIKSWVKTLKGQSTTRESVQYVPLQFPNTRALLPVKDCMTCTWKLLIVVVLVSLLIWILIVLMRRSKQA